MSNPRKALGSALESRVVERARKRGIPAHRQPGSGIFREHPNDAVVADLLVECKVRSHHPSLTDMLSWYYQVREAAKRQKYRDGIVVYNTKGERTPKVLIDLDTFLDIVARALDTRNGADVQ